MPGSEVRPRDEQELLEVLREASAKGHRIFPLGAGTKRHWGGKDRLPPGPVAEVRLTQLREITDLDPENLTVSVQAGVRYRDLQEKLADHGQWLPLDSPWGEEATLGGIVACGAGGPRQFLYGSPRDLVLGVRAALTHGKLVRFGGKTVKNVAGYDVSKLFVGSFGTLGLLTEITFKLRPLPEKESTLLFGFDGVEPLEAAAQELLKLPQPIAGLEALNRRTFDRVGGLEFPEGVAQVLAVEIHGTRRVVEAAARKVTDCLGGHYRADAELVDEASTRFWRRYQERLYQGWSSAELVVGLRCRVRDSIRALEALSRADDALCWIGAGTGEGYLRVGTEGARADELAEKLIALRTDASGLGCRLDVLVAPEEVLGRLKELGHHLWQLNDAAGPKMRSVRRIFDPENRLVPFPPFGEIDGRLPA